MDIHHQSNNLQYPFEQKKKLANKISKIKKKNDLITIYNIIRDENKNLNHSNNDNGIFMMFHNLSNQTYYKLDEFLQSRKTTTLSDTSDKSEYKPYSIEEFAGQDKLSPKLKYSNREKNLIKRQRYNENTNDSDVIYCDFNIVNTEESEGTDTATKN